MYIVARISILLVLHCAMANCNRPGTKTFTMSKNLPSRLYLPTWRHPEPKNRARTSDIEAVLENDLQVIPLAADHDQRNGFQYQPIISRQYSRGFTESSRYSQSVVPNVPQTQNTQELGSPISNVNEVKPITKSQLSREAVASSSTPKGNNPRNKEIQRSSSWCLRKFQTHDISLEQIPSAKLPRRKILTVNDQDNNAQHEKLPLQLTPPREQSIWRISRHPIDKVSVRDASSSTKFVADNGPWSKDMVLIGQPTAYTDQNIKPVFESNEYETNYDNSNNCDDYNDGDYQLGTANTPAPTSGSFNGPLKRPIHSKIPAKFTCSDTILGRFLTQAHQGYNYGYNTREHLPTNPILALLLSHYGRYLSGTREPRVYAYMAVNNIHNNKPFGSYKITGDYDNVFIR